MLFDIHKDNCLVSVWIPGTGPWKFFKKPKNGFPLVNNYSSTNNQGYQHSSASPGTSRRNRVKDVLDIHLNGIGGTRTANVMVPRQARRAIREVTAITYDIRNAGIAGKYFLNILYITCAYATEGSAA